MQKKEEIYSRGEDFLAESKCGKEQVSISNLLESYYQYYMAQTDLMEPKVT